MVNRKDKFQGQALSSMRCLGIYMITHPLQKQKQTLEQKAKDVYKISFNRLNVILVNNKKEVSKAANPI